MIYVAERNDLPEIVELSLEIPEVFTFENFPKPDRQKVTEFIYENWLSYPIFVYKDDKGTIKGFVGISVEPFWWSNEMVIKDYMFFVKPEYRKDLKVFNMLVEAVRDLSKFNKIPAAISFISSDRTETKRKLFERKGFKEAGFITTFGV